MQKSTHLLKGSAQNTMPVAATNPDGLGFTGGGSSFGSSFGSNSFGSSFGFDNSFGSSFGFDSGFGFGSNSFSFGESSFGFDSFSSDFGSVSNFQSNFGFNPNSFRSSSGGFSFNESFSVDQLNQSAFGKGSPLGGNGVMASSSNPSQSAVPEVDNWKEFMAFLFRMGPAWVQAFKDGGLNAPPGARNPNDPRKRPPVPPNAEDPRTREELIQRYIGQGGASGGGVRQFLTSTKGLLAIGGVVLGGVLIATVASSGGGVRPVAPRPRR